jgi:ribosomal protein S18 acetylase RimI-like enzyme
MLRDLRKAEVGQFNTLITREFPQEGALLGIDVDAQRRILARAFQPLFRFLLGFARLVRHPIVRFFVVESEGRVAATAVLSYGRRAGYIGAVSVDPAFRRRGLGRQVIGGCAADAKATGREFVVLDVIHDNAPAQALYRSVGYRPLRTGAFLRKDLAARPAPLPRPPGVRPLRRSDRKPLAAIAAAALPPEVARILPVEPGSFTLAPVIVRFLESETEAWVIDDGRGPVAFLRGTVGRAMQSGNLTSPILAPDLSTERSLEFLRYAESWLASKGVPRAVVEQWSDPPRVIDLLRSGGWVEAIPIDTLYLPLHA